MLQGLADARYTFTDIDVGAYGKQSDGGIFRSSSLYQLLNSKNFNMPNAKAGVTRESKHRASPSLLLWRVALTPSTADSLRSR